MARYYLNEVGLTTYNDLIKEKIAKLVGFDVSVLDVLPAEGKEHILYLVPSKSKLEKNVYDEYLWINDPDTSAGVWECIGSTSIDLDDYYTKGEIDSSISIIDSSISNINYNITNINSSISDLIELVDDTIGSACECVTAAKEEILDAIDEIDIDTTELAKQGSDENANITDITEKLQQIIGANILQPNLQGITFADGYATDNVLDILMYNRVYITSVRSESTKPIVGSAFANCIRLTEVNFLNTP